MDLIIQCLKDSDPEVRSSALNHLRDHETDKEFFTLLAPAMCGPLADLLNDPVQNIRSFAGTIHKGCRQQEPPKTIGETYKRGMQYIYSKQFAQGIALIAEAADKSEQRYAASPADFKSSENILPSARKTLAGYSRWKLKDYKKAATEYRKLISLSERVGTDAAMISFYYSTLGEIYERDLRDYANALSCYQSSLRYLSSAINAPVNQSDDYFKWDLDSLRFTIERMNIELNKNNGYTHRTIKYPNLDFRYFIIAASAPGLSRLTAVMFEDEDYIPIPVSDLPPPQAFEKLISKYSCIRETQRMGTYLIYSYLDKKRIDDADTILKAMVKQCPVDPNIMMFSFDVAEGYKAANNINSYDVLKKQGLDIAAKINVTVRTGGDPHFSSPEKTWQYFIDALKNKDVKTAVECFSPNSQTSYERTLEQLREKLPEMAADMAIIDRYKSGTEQEGVAKYSLVRQKEGKPYSFEVTFGNFAGDWKIVSF
jgi:tetratricopeptide (TPR) repeat protein